MGGVAISHCLDYKPTMHANIPSEAVVHPIFKQIACHPSGVIFSVKTGDPRKLWKTRHGYLQLAVGRTSYLAHRLIADVFVFNPESKPLINHKNGVKDDNRADNLEWCTQLENVRHARDVLGIKFSLPGFENPNSKVTEKDIRVMIRLWQFGLSESKISEIMEYAKPTISEHLKAHRMGRSDQSQAQPQE